MSEGDPTGFPIMVASIPLNICPLWCGIHIQNDRFCDDCEARIQEEFRKEKEEEKRMKDRDGPGGGSSEERVGSWWYKLLQRLAYQQILSMNVEELWS
ncbi:hypothetical protein TWF481_006354 [Arthrobotrys musiformis]|uniref:Uncharacterized protein n=1 Tax=Arthrobotrys musiformis TaxID=47236 RepID=A0AAV9WGF2_9PEZI